MSSAEQNEKLVRLFEDGDPKTTAMRHSFSDERFRQRRDPQR